MAANMNIEAVDLAQFTVAYAVAVANRTSVDAAFDGLRSKDAAALREPASQMLTAMSAERRDAFKQDALHAWNEWRHLHQLDGDDAFRVSRGLGTAAEYIAEHRENYPGEWWKPLYADA